MKYAENRNKYSSVCNITKYNISVWKKKQKLNCIFKGFELTLHRQCAKSGNLAIAYTVIL